MYYLNQYDFLHSYKNDSFAVTFYSWRNGKQILITCTLLWLWNVEQ